ncbi:MAG: class I SAM-dependent methyltransferase [Acidobacteria bacterium]|nr:class I SAM-dependent methyltransferase [Acidobacteriota bacterium]
MQTAVAIRSERFHQTIATRTKRVYDHLSAIYPASTFFFHSKAHRIALEMSGLRDGMKVLEIATGSGEMFRRLVRNNPEGHTCGVDLSPNMAARTQAHARKKFPAARLHCQAVDARALPYRDASFDSIFCCYLFELLSTDDVYMTMEEMQRVLKPRGKVTAILIGQQVEFFNKAYRVASSLVPAFWGRQVDGSALTLLESTGFRVTQERFVRQGFYPSRILTAIKD